MSGDQTWELQWEIEHGGTGAPPYDVVLEIEFCVGTGCTVAVLPRVAHRQWTLSLPMSVRFLVVKKPALL